jgi:hypothetical protein
MTLARMAGRWPGFHGPRGCSFRDRRALPAGQGTCERASMRINAVVIALAQGQVAGI